MFSPAALCLVRWEGGIFPGPGKGRDDEMASTMTFDKVFEAARQLTMADQQLLAELLSPLLS
jgi:hypothetical protein